MVNKYGIFIIYLIIFLLEFQKGKMGCAQSAAEVDNQ
jgi:hypothetical protein